MLKDKRFYFGFLGFLGFTGFEYFQTKSVADLCGFAFFSFFAYFWIAKVSVSIPDERYIYDVQKAKAFVFDIAILEITALFLISIFFSQFRELLVIAIAVCYSSLIVIYAAKLYVLEEKL